MGLQCDAQSTQLLANVLCVLHGNCLLRIEDLVAFMSGSKHFRELISASFGEKIKRFKSYALNTRSIGSTLWMCTIKGHFEELVWLIDKRSATIRDITWDSYSLFKTAAFHGHLDILKYLVDSVKYTIDIEPIIKALLVKLGERPAKGHVAGRWRTSKPLNHILEARRQKVTEYLNAALENDVKLHLAYLMASSTSGFTCKYSD